MVTVMTAIRVSLPLSHTFSPPRARAVALSFSLLVTPRSHSCATTEPVPPRLVVNRLVVVLVAVAVSFAGTPPLSTFLIV
jgi:hypothetical protein